VQLWQPISFRSKDSGPTTVVAFSGPPRYSALETQGALYRLCPVFGMTDSNNGVWLDYSFEVSMRVVKEKTRTEFKIKWPNFEGMKASVSLLESNRANGRYLKGIFGITDGGGTPCADYTDLNLQNAYFEGFSQGVEMTNLSVFNFFGELIHAAVNYPGSWYDTKLATASGLYFPKLSDSVTPPGMAILGDSVFVNRTRAANGKIIRVRKANEVSDIPEAEELT